MSSRVWITWEHQTRNLSMARLLDCQYIELTSNKGRLVRYAILAYKTIAMFYRLRPQELFFQNPSIVLGAICACYKIINPHVKAIGDFHNVALDRTKFSGLNSFIARNVDLTLVSNQNLCARVIEMGGRPFVMPDPIPEKHIACRDSDLSIAINGLPQKFIVFICSWASDEPILTVLNAYIKSATYGKGVHLLITGRVRSERLELTIEEYQQQGVRFLGFVSEEFYWQIIELSVCNIDLTTRDDCLVCGAYESIAVGNSVILSNNSASLSYFQDYCFFTDNSLNDLSDRIQFIVNAEDESRKKAQKAKHVYTNLDQERKKEINNLITSSKVLG